MFLPGIIVGNGVFVTAHFAAGYLFGAYARELVRRISDPMVITVVVLIALAIGGLFVLHQRFVGAKRADTYECWADCSCPACVAVVSLSVAGQPAGS